MDPLPVTIITVTYNAEATIAETLASIVGQTYPKLEIIVMDGGSTDRTLELVQPFVAAGLILRSEADRGVYDAMNKGVALATGAFVNFMNAGDRFLAKDVVERVVNNLTREGGDYVYGDVISVFGRETKHSRSRPPDYLWKNKPFNHQALFARREFLLRYPFDLSYSIAADYDQTYRAVRGGAALRRIPDLVVARVDMTTGVSKEKFWATVKEKVTINFRLAENKGKVIAYLPGHLLYQAAIYGLHRLGLFDRVIAWVGKRKQRE